MRSCFSAGKFLAFLGLLLLVIPVSALQLSLTVSTKTSLQLSHRATLERGALHQPVWSPDGKLLAVTGALGVWLFDPNNLRAAPRLEPHLKQVVAFSPDSKFAASLNETGDIVFWNTHAGVVTRTFYALKGRLIWINDLAFSPDGTQLAMAFGGGGTLKPTGGITVWDVATGNQVIDIRHKLEEPTRVVYSPDGNLLVAASYSGSARWDTKNWQVTDLRASGNLFDLSINADGTKIAFYSGYGGIDIIDLATSADTTETAASFTSLAFSPTESEILALSGNQKVEVRNLKQKRVVAELPAGDNVTFSADGRFLTYVDGSGLYIYDTLTYKRRERIDGFNDHIGQMRFLGGSAWLVYERSQNTLGWWNAQQPTASVLSLGVELAKTLKPVLPSYVDFRLDSTEDGRQFYQLRLDQLPSPRPDLIVVAQHQGCFPCTEDMSVKLQEATTGKVLHTFVGHDYPLSASVFSPDGRFVVTADADSAMRNHAVYVWDVEIGRRVTQLRDATEKSQLHQLVFSPDGSRLAIVHDAGVEIWDTTNWRLITSIAEQGYKDVLFSHSGTILITRLDQGEIRFWDSTNGTTLAAIENIHATNMTLSADDTLLALATAYGTIELWNLSDTYPD